jgi:hypothetical protein
VRTAQQMQQQQTGEPLDGHPLYAKVRTIGKGQRSFVQVARNKATGELVAIRFIPRGKMNGHCAEVSNSAQASLGLAHWPANPV